LRRIFKYAAEMGKYLGAKGIFIYRLEKFPKRKFNMGAQNGYDYFSYSENSFGGIGFLSGRKKAPAVRELSWR